MLTKAAKIEPADASPRQLKLKVALLARTEPNLASPVPLIHLLRVDGAKKHGDGAVRTGKQQIQILIVLMNRFHTIDL